MGKKKHVNRLSRRAATSTEKSPDKKKRKEDKEDGTEIRIEELIGTSQGSDSSSLIAARPPTGLQNIGNTCFFNSVIQSLYSMHLKLELEFNRNYTLPLSNAIADTFAQLHVIKRGTFKPNAIFDVIVQNFPQFKGRRQQDSHELYICLLSRLDDEMKMDKKQRPADEAEVDVTVNSLTRRLLNPFEGKLASLVTCDECHRKSATLELVYDLSLEIPGSAHLLTIPVRKTIISLGGNTKAKKKGKFAALTVDEPEIATTMTNTENNENNSNNDSVASTSEEAVVNVNNQPAVQETIENGSSSSTNAEQAEVESVSMDLSMMSVADELAAIDESEEAVDTAPASTLPSPTAAHSLATEIIEPPLPCDHISSSDPTIYDCLNSFTSTEKLSVADKNGFECIYCQHSKHQEEQGNVSSIKSKHLVDATRRITLLHRPQYLVLHLKRLLPGGKFAGFVRFPMKLDMTAYLSTVRSCAAQQATQVAPELVTEEVEVAAYQSDTVIPHDVHNTDNVAIEREAEQDQVSVSQAQEESEDQQPSNDEEREKLHEVDADAQEANEENQSYEEQQQERNEFLYTLHAVVVHQGGAYGGHYVAYVRRGVDWYFASDGTVRKSTASEVLGCQAYMLFYKAATWES